MIVPEGQPPPMDPREICLDRTLQALEWGVVLHPPWDWGRLSLSVAQDTPEKRAQLHELGLDEGGSCLARSDGRPWYAWSPTILPELAVPIFDGPASNAVSVTAYWRHDSQEQRVALLLRLE